MNVWEHAVDETESEDIRIRAYLLGTQYHNRKQKLLIAASGHELIDEQHPFT